MMSQRLNIMAGGEPILIKDILIQGNKGQMRDLFLVRMRIDPLNLTLGNMEGLFLFNRYILLYAGTFYFFNTYQEGSPVQIEKNSENAQALDALTILFQEMGMTVNNMLVPNGKKRELASLHLPPLSVDRVNDVVSLIESIANHTQQEQEDGCITRSITDEFTFYPLDVPYSVEEYKAIIQETASIASRLPPGIHLVLATFPVLWPDGGVHNCGLYVQSPNDGITPLLHHFSKKYPVPGDIRYKDQHGQYYALTTNDDCIRGEHPQFLLQDTAVCTGDVNQYESALKVSLLDGRELIVSLGICMDHAEGVEREQVHGLISQLQKHNQTVPFYCSHVITSASIEEYSDHTLSTVSHADPVIIYRRPEHFPNRDGFIPSFIESPFSGLLSTEIFPQKWVGILHGDLFQHIVGNQDPEQLALQINEQDADGNTLMHFIFLEADFDYELMAKRIYVLVLYGGNLDSCNNKGHSVYHVIFLLSQLDKNQIVASAVDSALQWRRVIADKNKISPEDGRTELTRLAIEHQIDMLDVQVLAGANPYLKDGHGESLLDILYLQCPDEVFLNIKQMVLRCFLETQYGHTDEGADNDQMKRRFTPPSALLEQTQGPRFFDYKEKAAAVIKPEEPEPPESNLHL